MPPSHRKIVNIQQPTAEKTLSRGQKQFNSLIKKIDAQKKLLREWEDTLPLYRKKVAEEYDASFAAYNAVRIEFAHLLDRAHDDSRFKKKDREKIAHIIGEILEALLDSHDDEIRDLYNKYNVTDFDSDKQEAETMAAQYAKSMAETLFNIDLPDDIDMSSPEKFQAALEEKLRQQDEAARQQGKPRQKTAKQLEKEAKQQEQQQHISQSIQEVYRKLVRTLHPDREQDPDERERKTELMQRVNIAYGNKDLLQLLELQLETEQIDQAHLNNISEDRLKHYNKILKEQLNELNQEIADIEFQFGGQLSYPQLGPLKPKQLVAYLDRDIRELKQAKRDLENDVRVFGNFANLKDFLKQYRIPPQQNFDLFDEFGELYY